MADAHGSGPCGRKSLRVQLPFRPFLFSGSIMKKYDYYRPTVTVAKKKKIRKTISFSFLKPLIWLLLLAALGVAGYHFGLKAYRGLAALRVGTWTASQALVSGAEGTLAKELQTIANSKVGNPFSIQDAVRLQKEISEKYPYLCNVQVKRGLMSGKLKVSVDNRTPLAKFISTDEQEKLIDADGVIYQDPRSNPLRTVTAVELEGAAPSKLDKEWTDLIKSSLKLKKQLDFTVLKLNLTENTVEMKLPDTSVIRFGQAKNLRQKVYRAAQIESSTKEKQMAAHELDFTYFDEGKVFLRQIAH